MVLCGRPVPNPDKKGEGLDMGLATQFCKNSSDTKTSTRAHQEINGESLLLAYVPDMGYESEEASMEGPDPRGVGCRPLLHDACSHWTKFHSAH